MQVNIKRFTPNAPIPTRATEGAAGYDLPICATLQLYRNTIVGLDGRILATNAEGCILIPLGWGIEIPPGYYGRLVPRSSKNHWLLSGEIDSDFRGQMFAKTTTALLHAHKPKFEAFDRVMQLIIQKHETPELVVTDELGQTARGEGGHGSTGR